jgi:hypothetical protein
MNTDIRRKINQKHRAYAKARKTKKKKDKDRYKRLQIEVKYEIRKAGKKNMTDVICDKDNTNKLWSYIKSKGQEFIGVAPLKNQQGYLRPSPFPSMTNINITEHGVYKLLKNQKPHKATGPNEVPAFILRSAAQQLAPILSQIYRHSLDIGAVPQDRRDAWVVPIFKKR